jgi:hypothetical protein
MANAFPEDVIEVTQQEHTAGDLLKSSLQTSENLFDLHGVVAWQNLWQGNDKKVERQTLNVLRNLTTEDNFIYVGTRSLLPPDIVCNRVSRPLRENKALAFNAGIVCYSLFNITISDSKTSSSLRKACDQDGHYFN